MLGEPLLSFIFSIWNNGDGHDKIKKNHAEAYRMGDEKKKEEQLKENGDPLLEQISEPTGATRDDLEQLYVTLQGNVSDVIYSLSPDGIITSLNPAFEKITGLSSNDWIGKSFSHLIHPNDVPLALEKFLLVLQGEPSEKFELRTLSSTGNYLTGEFTATPQILDGKVVNVLGIARDITAHKQMAEQLRSLTLNDELTGLYNRRGFFPIAEKFLNLAKREKKGLLIIYLDLDDLKIINDTMGHHEGDRALRDVAGILKKTYRGTDILARMGGDEFAIIPLGATKDDIGTLTGRLQKNVENHNATGMRKYTLAISFGTSCFDKENPCSIDELINRADKMMYKQKRPGRRS
jgi:diguanylate cyclase (GGDEF)-like protein/PAS domain S-box-containing protein